MIRGNETAIALGLDVLLALNPGKRVTLEEIVAFCEAARAVVGGSTKPFTKQDLWFLEHRALMKMKCRARCQSLQQFAESFAS